LILIGFTGNNMLPARLGEVLQAPCAAVKTDLPRMLGALSATAIIWGMDPVPRASPSPADRGDPRQLGSATRL
jgi:hypothetical protein